MDVDEPGSDGTTPLCAACLWGNAPVVKYLLETGKARVNAVNDGTLWTPLHAAAFQEHGKVIHILMLHGANPEARDAEERTPADYATLSEAVWPLFAACGCTKSSKEDLVRKGIIRKIEEGSGEEKFGDLDRSDVIKGLSRPGSSYRRVANFPPMSAAAVSSLPVIKKPSKRMTGGVVMEEEEDEPRRNMSRGYSLTELGY